MRYSPSEKLAIIRLVEQSHLLVKRTLESGRVGDGAGGAGAGAGAGYGVGGAGGGGG